MSQKNLLYIAGVDYESAYDTGIINKINSQKKAFEKYGFEVDLLFLGQKKLYFNGEVKFEYKNKLQKFKILYEFLKQTSYRFYYFRQILNNFYIQKIFNLIKKEKKSFILLEIPTNTSVFLFEVIRGRNISMLNKFRIIFQLLFLQPFLFYKTDLILVVSDYGFLEKIFKNKVMIINNGIDIDNIPIRNYKPINNEFNLIGVASLNFWHGYDRVINGIYKYKNEFNDIKINFHIVGEGPELDNLKSLAKELNIENNIIFHGIKKGIELNDLFNKCDLAIGSAGFHRKYYKRKYNKTSGIKYREYCARGIPFILSDNDVDFNEGFEFSYKVSYDDSPINIVEIYNWYQSIIKNHPEFINEMREYAEKNLTWEVKLKQVIEKMMEKTKLGNN